MSLPPLRFTRRYPSDALHLPSLVESTAKNFDMKEVSADKGYSGAKCHEAIASVGATPYIPFKRQRDRAGGRRVHKNVPLLPVQAGRVFGHYHRRSNVESTMMMIKTKFGDCVRSKTERCGRNEVLAKILCHNICCLISAIYELGIVPMLTGKLPLNRNGCPQTPSFLGDLWAKPGQPAQVRNMLGKSIANSRIIVVVFCGQIVNICDVRVISSGISCKPAGWSDEDVFIRGILS